MDQIRISRYRHVVLRRLILVAVTAAAFGQGEEALAAPSSALSGFHTPNWAAQCVVAEDVLGGPSPLYCWTPNNGFTVKMFAASRVTKSYTRHNKGYRDRFFARRPLAFGEHWGFRIAYVGYFYRCSSRADGLRCWNQAGHGWWIGRYVGYRIF